ncbi:methyl-accepting chemotaxis protein [Bacillus sp. FJAT-45350]|uniref:methyl-accepting chemotaxis protein n=1 Tax=Bacillus sp. FJAT-45350 TaxID=2011014 RepID=UPI003F8D2662
MASGHVDLNHSIERSASTFKEMEDELNNVKHATSSILSEANTSNLHAEDGEKRLTESINAITNIRKQNEANVAVIEELGENSKEINNIIKMIQEISSQTSLLSLNAAIEAARAGEAGKGFAVVADEIRKLSSQSEKATTTISEIITNISIQVEQSVSKSRESAQIIQDGEQSILETSKAFSDIVQSVALVLSQANEIDHLVNNVNKKSIDILHAVEGIREISNQSTESTEMISATMQEQVSTMENVTQSAEDLSKVAIELEEKISSFKI